MFISYVIYFDEVNFERETHEQVIDLIVTEFVHIRIQKIEKQEAYVKVVTDDDFWAKMRTHCEISYEDERWLNYADKALKQIDPGDIWRGVLECCKIIKLYLRQKASDVTSKLCVIYRGWYGVKCRYSEIERTMYIEHLLD